MQEGIDRDEKGPHDVQKVLHSLDAGEEQLTRALWPAQSLYQGAQEVCSM